jgi:tetratricopeptide (TPR) repeat protein
MANCDKQDRGHINGRTDEMSFDIALRLCALTSRSRCSTDVDAVLAQVLNKELAGISVYTQTSVKIDDFQKNEMASEGPLKGGVGEVWIAQDEHGRQIALKTLQPRYRNTPLANRFLNEVAITASLSHPNIITLYGVGKLADGSLFYTMPFVRGETLTKVINSRQRSRNNLLRQFVRICHAIKHAHDRGIIHRDLNPANILLGQDDVSYVIDWGLAKRIEVIDKAWLFSNLGDGNEEPAATMVGALIGTLQYMSPEQATGGEVGTWTDVFCLGATLYAIVTGASPYQMPSDTLSKDQVIQCVKNVDFLPPSRVPGSSVSLALEAICLKAMAKEKDDRYANVDELRLDIERWLADESLSVYRDPWPVSTVRWVRKHPTIAMGVASTFMVGFPLISFVAVQSHNAKREVSLLYDDVNERLKEVTYARKTLSAQLYQYGEKLKALQEITLATQAAERSYQNEPTFENEVGLVETRIGLALMQHKTGQVEVALDTYQSLLERLNNLIQQKPSNVELLRLKVRLLGNKGMSDLAHRENDQPPTTAVSTYTEALGLLNLIQTLESSNENLSTTSELARINGNLADALSSWNYTEQELKHRRAAITILKQLVSNGQSNGQFLSVHAVRLASKLFKMNRDNEALRELHEIMDVFPYIEAGEPENWGQQIDAAKCLVRLADTEKDSTVSDKYRHRAVEVLTLMQKNDIFAENPRLVQTVESDSQLSSLKGRADFTQLLLRIRLKSSN